MLQHMRFVSPVSMIQALGEKWDEENKEYIVPAMWVAKMRSCKRSGTERRSRIAKPLGKALHNGVKLSLRLVHFIGQLRGSCRWILKNLHSMRRFMNRGVRKWLLLAFVIRMKWMIQWISNQLIASFSSMSFNITVRTLLHKWRNYVTKHVWNVTGLRSILLRHVNH